MTTRPRLSLSFIHGSRHRTRPIGSTRRASAAAGCHTNSASRRPRSNSSLTPETFPASDSTIPVGRASMLFCGYVELCEYVAWKTKRNFTKRDRPAARAWLTARTLAYGAYISSSVEWGSSNTLTAGNVAGSSSDWPVSNRSVCVAAPLACTSPQATVAVPAGTVSRWQRPASAKGSAVEPLSPDCKRSSVNLSHSTSR